MSPATTDAEVSGQYAVLVEKDCVQLRVHISHGSFLLVFSAAEADTVAAQLIVAATVARAGNIMEAACPLVM